MEEKHDDLMFICFSEAIDIDFPYLFKYSIFKDMISVEQSPEYHKEGNVAIHSCLVSMQMDQICRKNNIWGDRRLVLMLSALFHDCGKKATTKWNEEKKKWQSYNHDVVGTKLTREFLNGVFHQEIVDRVCNIVELHMAHTRPEKDWTTKGTKKFLSKIKFCTKEDLLFMFTADTLGRIPQGKINQKLLDILTKEEEENKNEENNQCSNRI